MAAAPGTYGPLAITGTTDVASLRARPLPPWFGWVNVAIAVATPIHCIFEGLAVLLMASLSTRLSRLRPVREFWMKRSSGNAWRSDRIRPRG